ncbi:hypothetical protein Tco_0418938 [Tanacetum coccineum]
MSTNEQTLLSQPTFSMRNTLGKEQAPQDLVRPVFDKALQEYYEKNYHQILPIIAEKMHQEKVQQEKLKAVKARLNFEEASRHSESGTPSGRRSLKERLGPRHARSISESPEPRRGRSKSPREKDPERRTVFRRLEKGVFHRLGDKEKNVYAHSRDLRYIDSNHSIRRVEDRKFATKVRSLQGIELHSRIRHRQKMHPRKNGSYCKISEGSEEDIGRQKPKCKSRAL